MAISTSDSQHFIVLSTCNQRESQCKGYGNVQPGCLACTDATSHYIIVMFQDLKVQCRSSASDKEQSAITNFYVISARIAALLSGMF